MIINCKQRKIKFKPKIKLNKIEHFVYAVLSCFRNHLFPFYLSARPSDWRTKGVSSKRPC